MRNPLPETLHSNLYRNVWAVFDRGYVSDPCKVAPGHEDHIHEDVECVLILLSDEPPLGHRAEIVPPCREDNTGAVEVAILPVYLSSVHRLKTIVDRAALLVPCSG